MNATLSDRIKKLPPEKLDQLLKQFKPGAKLKSPVAPPKPAKRPFREAQDENFYLTVETPGVLDSLRYTTRKREPLNPDQIEVEVHAACVNFRDVAVALGIYPMPPCGTMPEFGCDGAGRVVKVGSAVTKFKPGDDIFFLASDSTFSRYARTREMASFPKPSHWSYEEAAGLALVYITVAYALRVPGRLARGERIVVHSAAGGIGLAAIQLARKIGAEIFATAGTDEKREYLRSIGIEHIMDSRSLSFVDEITAATNGEGVDVVLNSLAGEAIDAGIKLLRPDGRFLELGKRDLAPGRMLDLGRFTLTLLFAAVDTSYLFHLFPERLDPIVAELRADFASGALQPLPTRTFRSSEVLDAFRYMTTGKHIGRIVVSMKGEPVMVATS